MYKCINDKNACSIRSPARPSPATQIVIKGEDGAQFALEVKSCDTVKDVKHKIQEKCGIPEQAQTLTWSCKELSDNRTLRDYGIRQDSTLYLSVKKRTVRFEAGPHGCISGNKCCIVPLGSIISPDMIPTPIPDKGYCFSTWTKHGKPVQIETLPICEDTVFTAEFKPEHKECSSGNSPIWLFGLVILFCMK